MASTSKTLAPLALAALLVAGGCGNADDDAAGSNTTVESGDSSVSSVTTDSSVTTAAADSEPVADTDRQNADVDIATEAGMREALEKIAAGYRSVDGVWPGFVPNEHPVVLAYKNDGGKLVAALAINHPDPAALGDATPVDVEGLPAGTAHRIESPVDAEILEAMPTFEFHATLGGVDSFAMNAGGSDAFFDPLTTDYVSTLLHEMFHRYQDEAFDGDIGAQDVDGYAYSPANLELAVLEDRALRVAVTTDDVAERERAAQWFAALRLNRRSADDRVTLDDSQERFEGSARFLEHGLAGDNDGFTYHADNFDIELIGDLEPVDVKDRFGFGRFYASGAAILQVAEALGVSEVAERIEAGESPADVLIDRVGVVDADTTALVSEARSALDPDGVLDAAAVAASEVAATEPDPFGDVSSSDGTETGASEGDGSGGGGAELTDEEFACLEGEGVDFSGEEVEVSDEQFEACLGRRSSS